MTRQERTGALLEAFRAVYPSAHCELVFANPLQLLIATVLSAQCTDKRVNIVTETLFQRYKTAEDFAQVSQEELEEAIRSTGFFRNKAKNIRALATALVECHGGLVPPDMEALTALPGVGRKTANVVLGNAFGLNEGFVVDTHVTRLSGRLGLTRRRSKKTLCAWCRARSGQISAITSSGMDVAAAPHGIPTVPDARSKPFARAPSKWGPPAR